MREPEWGHRVVPIIPDEGRTFGMDPLFNDAKIYARPWTSWLRIGRGSR